jgi:hypothetical protein
VEPKFCKDCRYFKAWSNPDRMDLSDCDHPESLKKPDGYLVTGGPFTLRMCQSMRNGPCGEDARLFEAKDASA